MAGELAFGLVPQHLVFVAVVARRSPPHTERALREALVLPDLAIGEMLLPQSEEVVLSAMQKQLRCVLAATWTTRVRVSPMLTHGASCDFFAVSLVPLIHRYSPEIGEEELACVWHDIA